MSTSRRRQIVVATSGSAASRSAIAYAAEQAQARGLELEIVHVIPSTLPVGAFGGAPDVALRRSGREVLALGERVARQVAPQADVTTALLTGTRPDALVRHSEGAELLVVGAPPHDLIERIWTGATVTGTAARATCPTAIIPPGWAPTASHRVLVGLKNTRHAGDLLAKAFSVAAATQAELRIVHAWHFGSPYDEAIAQRVPTPEWERDEARAVEGQLIDLRMAYPDVHVVIDVVHGQPAYTLVRASRDADVLVISRPAHGGFIHHLGATARAVIRESACPVLVVPPVHESTDGTPTRTESALQS